MERPAALLLHAFPLDARMWSAQVEALRGRWPVLAPNLPGFGGRPPVGPRLSDMARAMLEDARVAGVERFVPVGLSMGGYVAFRVVEMAPERVAGLVLADTRASADSREVRERRTTQATRARAEGTAFLAEELPAALLGETTRRERPAVEARVRELIGAQDGQGVAAALEAMRDRPDSTPLLSRIRVPVLVMAGAEDRVTPVDEAAAMAGAFPDARLAVIPGAGHLSAVEAPAAFNDLLESFLRSLG